jgi:hypothetical protein
MKYPGSGQHRRFYHPNSEEYSEDDREILPEYMREKGYKKPVDVWLDTLKALLEVKMDNEKKWTAELTERAYPGDAMWAITHMQSMYLAICTPSSQRDEFLLTENAYNVHEGPTSCFTDPRTGEERQVYNEFHAFALISPKLIMMLRSCLLPDALEDSSDRIRELRESRYAENVRQHADPSRTKSCLEDLPISKARNSYTDIDNGRLVLARGEDGTERSDHRFCFRSS